MGICDSGPEKQEDIAKIKINKVVRNEIDKKLEEQTGSKDENKAAESDSGDEDATKPIKMSKT